MIAMIGFGGMGMGDTKYALSVQAGSIQPSGKACQSLCSGALCGPFADVRASHVFCPSHLAVLHPRYHQRTRERHQLLAQILVPRNQMFFDPLWTSHSIAADAPP